MACPPSAQFCPTFPLPPHALKHLLPLGGRLTAQRSSSSSSQHGSPALDCPVHLSGAGLSASTAHCLASTMCLMAYLQRPLPGHCAGHWCCPRAGLGCQSMQQFKIKCKSMFFFCIYGRKQHNYANLTEKCIKFPRHMCILEVKIFLL